MQLTLQERLESLKAGLLGAIAYGGLYALTRWGLAFLGLANPSPHILGHLASALLSGFLFGVTYRYIVRDDQNGHLRDGAVLAFTLVRGGGLLELGPWSDPTLIALWLGEGLVGFGLTRWVLDGTMAAQWLKPLNAAPPLTPHPGQNSNQP